LAGDSPVQFCPFLVIERTLLQGAVAEIGFRRPVQARHQIGSSLGQGRQLWWGLLEQLPPEIPGRIDQQAAVL
jgi:hypothetical protein